MAETNTTQGTLTPQTQQPQQTQAQAAAQTQAVPAAQTPQIDYDKITQILEGRLGSAEDATLKGYFKQQGMSKEEMEQAISQFKAQKAAQQPDVSAIQQQLTQAQAIAQKAEIEKQATLEALELGVDVKTLPYLLKMADLTGAVGNDGKINPEALKTALSKVLEDVPALKPAQEQNQGFQQIGAAGKQQQQTDEDALKRAFGL